MDRDEEDVAVHGRRRQAAHPGRVAQGRIQLTPEMFQFRTLGLRAIANAKCLQSGGGLVFVDLGFVDFHLFLSSIISTNSTAHFAKLLAA